MVLCRRCTHTRHMQMVWGRSSPGVRSLRVPSPHPSVRTCHHRRLSVRMACAYGVRVWRVCVVCACGVRVWRARVACADVPGQEYFPILAFFVAFSPQACPSIPSACLASRCFLFFPVVSFRVLFLVAAARPSAVIVVGCGGEAPIPARTLMNVPP